MKTRRLRTWILRALLIGAMIYIVLVATIIAANVGMGFSLPRLG